MMGVPFGLSAAAAFFITIWIKDRHLHACLNVILKWAAENGSFYLATWACGLLLPKTQRIFKEGKQSIGQIALVEGLDTILRCMLFLLSSYFPKQEEWLTAGGSFLLDLVFYAALAQSHRLPELLSYSSKAVRNSGLKLKKYWQDWLAGNFRPRVLELKIRGWKAA